MWPRHLSSVRPLGTCRFITFARAFRILPGKRRSILGHRVRVSSQINCERIWHEKRALRNLTQNHLRRPRASWPILMVRSQSSLTSPISRQIVNVDFDLGGRILRRVSAARRRAPKSRVARAVVSIVLRLNRETCKAAVLGHPKVVSKTHHLWHKTHLIVVCGFFCGHET
jgi:hypothetical protein